MTDEPTGTIRRVERWYAGCSCGWYSVEVSYEERAHDLLTMHLDNHQDWMVGGGPKPEWVHENA